MIVLGWAIGKTRWGDDNGVSHLLVDRGKARAEPLCGSKVRTGGIVDPTPTLGNPCGTCLKMADRRGR